MNRKTGFTLVEMMTVIIIITILAAMTFTVIGRVRRHAREGTCRMEVSNLNLAMTQYQSDQAVFPPDQKAILPLLPATALRRHYMNGNQLVKPLRHYRYYDFPSTRLYTVAGYTDNNDPDMPSPPNPPQPVVLFVDRFADPSSRTIFWYSFDNNDVEDGVNPAGAPLRPGEVANQNWNITNVSRTKSDIWCAGADGQDYVVYSDGTTTDRNAPTAAGFATYQSVSILQGQDDIGNW